MEQQLEAGPADEVADDLVQLKSNLAQLIDLTKGDIVFLSEHRTWDFLFTRGTFSELYL